MVDRRASILNTSLTEMLDTLPQTFDLEAIKKKRLKDQKFCQLCEDKFGGLTAFNKKSIRHCKMCAKAVC
jgi:hypothetical protein